MPAPYVRSGRWRWPSRWVAAGLAAVLVSAGAPTVRAADMELAPPPSSDLDAAQPEIADPPRADFEQAQPEIAQPPAADDEPSRPEIDDGEDDD